MNRGPVESTCVRSVGYDRGARLLEIEFTGRAVYEYLAVPARIHRGLMGADSHGRYFNRWIRGRYDYRKLTDGQ